VPHGTRLADVRKERLRSLCDAGPPPGLLAYSGRKAVGWVTLGPRTEFLKLARSPVMGPWTTRRCGQSCASSFRPNIGIAAPLQGAVDYAARRGARILEAYPVDPRDKARDDSMWHGAKSMFDRAGFTEVARRRPQRPVMRIELRAAGR
jgi:hypothetical protein